MVSAGQTCGWFTISVAECHHLLADTKLYCFVTEAHGCGSLPRVVSFVY